MQKLTFIELNEFNPDLMRKAADDYSLVHVARLLGMRHSETHTADEIEHQGLDPWVQWVGVHTGRPTIDHNIRRLGLTSKQGKSQIWNMIAQRGGTWGVWGVMNAPMASSDGTLFFMPDPWSFEEKAYPPYLNDLLALPRYAAKNYLEMRPLELVRAGLRLGRYFAAPSRWSDIPVIARWLLKGTLTAGFNMHTLTTLVDYIGVRQFIRLKRKGHPDFSVIFLNHIAHLQHQFWRRGDLFDPNMKFGLLMCNEMLNLIFKHLDDGEAVLIANGMRQKNVHGDGWCVYRQKSAEGMLRALGIDFDKVEQCMTNDANILFKDPATADQAMLILSSTIVQETGKPIFYCERETTTQVFYQLSLDDRVAPGTSIASGERRIPFDQVLELICERTGAHEQNGDAFAEGIVIPDKMHNHELHHVILRHFEAEVRTQ